MLRPLGKGKQPLFNKSPQLCKQAKHEQWQYHNYQCRVYTVGLQYLSFTSFTTKIHNIMHCMMKVSMDINAHQWSFDFFHGKGKPQIVSASMFLIYGVLKVPRSYKIQRVNLLVESQWLCTTQNLCMSVFFWGGGGWGMNKRCFFRQDERTWDL